MYNVKRIGVWKYEAKMSRDWAPPHWDEGYIKKGVGQGGSVITNLGPRWTFLSQLEGAK
jgi:hypothetical protein